MRRKPSIEDWHKHRVHTAFVIGYRRLLIYSHVGLTLLARQSEKEAKSGRKERERLSREGKSGPLGAGRHDSVYLRKVRSVFVRKERPAEGRKERPGRNRKERLSQKRKERPSRKEGTTKRKREGSIHWTQSMRGRHDRPTSSGKHDPTQAKQEVAKQSALSQKRQARIRKVRKRNVQRIKGRYDGTSHGVVPSSSFS